MMGCESFGYVGLMGFVAGYLVGVATIVGVIVLSGDKYDR